MIVVPVAVQTVSATFLVKVGSRYESAADNGLSHFVEHMFFRGTRRLPSAYQVNHAMEDLGGMLEAATQTDFTSYDVTLPHESAKEGIALLGEILREPIFDKIEVEKRILKEEILEDLDEEGREIDIDNISRAQLFGDHPLGFTITGSIANVMRFSRDDLRRHVARHYGARNCVLSIAGKFANPEAMLDVAERAFEALPSGGRSVCDALRFGDSRFRYVDDQGSQTDLRLSYPGISLRDPRAMALSLVGRVLDDGMSTRVHRTIVDELGLAYDAFAGEDNYEDGGAFDFGASVAHESVTQVVTELRAVADAIGDDLSEAELDKARRRLNWGLESIIDDEAEVAEFYAVNALFDLPDTLESTRRDAARVTVEDARSVAKTVFASEPYVAAVGMLAPDQERDLRRLVTLRSLS